MSSQQAKHFVQEIIGKYLISDIDSMLKIEPANLPAGPVLATAVNGLDVLGAVRYGFATTSDGFNTRQRFQRFVLDRLIQHFVPSFNGQRREVAIMMYQLRCGITHEWTPNVHIAIFREQVDRDAKIEIYKDGATLLVNVDELANAVKREANRIVSATEYGTEHFWGPNELPTTSIDSTDIPGSTDEDISALLKPARDYRILTKTISASSNQGPTRHEPPPPIVPITFAARPAI